MTKVELSSNGSRRPTARCPLPDDVWLFAACEQLAHGSRAAPTRYGCTPAVAKHAYAGAPKSTAPDRRTSIVTMRS